MFITRAANPQMPHRNAKGLDVTSRDTWEVRPMHLKQHLSQCNTGFPLSLPKLLLPALHLIFLQSSAQVICWQMTGFSRDPGALGHPTVALLKPSRLHRVLQNREWESIWSTTNSVIWVNSNLQTLHLHPAPLCTTWNTSSTSWYFASMFPTQINMSLCVTMIKIKKKCMAFISCLVQKEVWKIIAYIWLK